MPGVKGTSLLRGRALTAGEVSRVVDACVIGEESGNPAEVSGNPAEVSGTAILGVLYGAGLRRAELVALDLGDYEY